MSADARAVLEERARLLAGPEPTSIAETGGRQLLVFERAGESYGLPLDQVIEALPPTPVTPLPGARAGLAGVAAHGANVIAVVELAGLRAAGPPAARAAAPLVVAAAGDMEIGFLADRIVGVMRLTEDEASERPAGLEHWILAAPSGQLAVIDLEALAQDPRVRVDE